MLLLKRGKAGLGLHQTDANGFWRMYDDNRNGAINLLEVCNTAAYEYTTLRPLLINPVRQRRQRRQST